ncbi:hypothetical protein BSKO_01930 [Bryopsis sp. KO-2023]|nr:hypothetical protein BSKO_01930 [Bryopsis sp. KO-2023]
MLRKSLENARRLAGHALWPAGSQLSQSYSLAAPLSVWRGMELPIEGLHQIDHNRHSTAAVAGRIRSQVEYPLVTGTPYTLSGALLPSIQARVVTEVGPGNRIVYANEAWEELCGFTLSEVQGSCGLKFIQGPDTEASAVRKIQTAVESSNRVQVVLTNYKRNGQPFKNRLQITPLLGPTGRVTHLLGILREV